MIVHVFVCDTCHVFVEDTQTKETHICSQCGGEMYWDLKGIAIHGNYETPIHSDALAINPCQKAEHEKLFPNIRLDGQCRPIFDNFVDHENYLKKTGYVKLPKKIKVEGKKYPI